MTHDPHEAEHAALARQLLNWANDAGDPEPLTFENGVHKWVTTFDGHPAEFWLEGLNIHMHVTGEDRAGAWTFDRHISLVLLRAMYCPGDMMWNMRINLSKALADRALDTTHV